MNALTHWAGAAAALLVAGPLLAWASARQLPLWPFAVFSVSMLLLYAASATYHSLNLNERGMRRLRKLDHAAIFVLIAGTYTPVAYFGLNDVWRGGALWVVWETALGGVLLKLFTLRLPRAFSTGLYLGLGWLGLAFLPQLVHTLSPAALLWLAAGGLLYTAGAVVYGTKRWNLRPGFGFHEIWHLFVLAGTAAHTVMLFQLG